MSISSPDNRIYRMASLTLANAMLLQEVLAQSDSNIKTLRETTRESNIVTAFEKQWQYISDNIDFTAVFRIPIEILQKLPSSPETTAGILSLAEVTIDISSSRAALRHDLMGRLFHRLLSDAKYYGAFYTKIPSATLLLQLTIDESKWGIDWSDPDQVRNLKIADFACGTGTLLKAGLTSIVDRYIDESVLAGTLPEIEDVSRSLIEEGVWGFDVLFSASHLAATSLAMHNPNVTVKQMRLYTVPLGGKSKSLGSIDFGNGRTLRVQTDLSGGLMGAEKAADKKTGLSSVKIPDFDLIAMNPPFNRSVNGNLLFGSENATERKELQVKLGEQIKKWRLNANITAGLGAVFIAFAEKYLKKNGSLALIIPKSVLVGSSWEPTRKLFSKYDLKYVISSHEPDNWNFSENTQLSEVMLILSKRDGKQKPSDTRFVNIFRQPKSSVEALTFSKTVRESNPALLTALSGTCELVVGSEKIGEMVAHNLTSTPGMSWGLPTVFAQTELGRVSYHLSKGDIFLPGTGIVGKINLVQLSKVAELGPDGRDIYDGFDLASGKTTYAAYWGYDSNAVDTLIQTPNESLNPLTKAKPNRPLRNAIDLWQKAGSLMLPKELWLTLNRLSAVTLDNKALSNVWWPTVWRGGTDSEKRRMEKHLCLWMNSSLGLVTMLMNRQETRGAWVKFPKIWYESLYVIDLRKLNSAQLQELDDLWVRVSKTKVMSFPDMDKDPVRKDIDDTFAKILGLGGLDPIRALLAQEPTITMKIP